VTAGTEYIVGSPSEATGTILSNDQESTIGLYNGVAGGFYLRNSNTSGVADIVFQYGPTESSLTAITGDWNGDGISTIGLYNQATGTVYLRNENSPGVADITFQFGPAGNNLVPLAGNWNGNTDGADFIGLYSPTTATVYLRNSNTSGVADTTFQYGQAGNNCTPIAGNWNGNTDGADFIGLYSPTTATVYLRNSNTTGIADTTFQYGQAGNNCTPIAGHWNAVSSTLTTTSSSVTASDAITTLTQPELDAITKEAIQRWQASGVNADATARLEAATIAIANLNGPKLAVIENGVIYLDSTAAGHGWFVDSTPSSDEEYTATATGVAMCAKSSTEAVDRIDLLTVVEQELGKIAGLEDLTDCVVHDQIGVGSRSSLLAAG
jgi:hypothetical protein